MADSGSGINSWQHLALVSHKTLEDVAWIRDIIFGGVLSIAGLGLQVFWNLVPLADWQAHKWRWIGSIVLPIAAVVLLDITKRLMLAPWRVYRDQAAQYAAELHSSQERIESLKAELETVRNQRSRDWAGDWKELSAHFSTGAARSVRADWHRTSAGKGWRFAGASRDIHGVEVVCRNAGRLLIASPKVSQSVPESIKSIADPMERWLYYLKHRGFYEATGFGSEQLDDGKMASAEIGGIRDFAGTSANECLECAGKEF